MQGTTNACAGLQILKMHWPFYETESSSLLQARILVVSETLFVQYSLSQFESIEFGPSFIAMTTKPNFFCTLFSSNAYWHAKRAFFFL